MTGFFFLFVFFIFIARPLKPSLASCFSLYVTFQPRLAYFFVVFFGASQPFWSACFSRRDFLSLFELAVKFFQCLLAFLNLLVLAYPICNF